MAASLAHVKTVALAGDHAAPALKAHVAGLLEDMGYATLDLGTHGSDSVDYPDYAHKLANALAAGQAEMGVLLCGTGIGISIAANRHAHVRAALCHNAETARLAREHNDANVLVLGARVVTEAVAAQCVQQFFTTAFAGGRHERRVAKLGRDA